MNESQIGNSELISTVNSRLVLQAVRALQPTFRAEVARKTRLKPATVTGIVTELLDQQLLRETPVTGDVGPRGGRPPQLLQVNGDARRILSIDLEPDVIRVALTNLLVEVLEFREEPIDRFSEPSVVCGQILQLCRQVLSKVKKGRLQGIGLSLPGLINRHTGTLLSSTNMPKWREVAIGPMLARELGMPVRVDRSVHLAALHARWINPNPNGTTLIISIRTGIGMSLMHRGDIYRSTSGFDGEIGHTVVDLNGKLCECGGRGCLETFVSASSICARAEALLAKGRAGALKKALEAGEKLRTELIYRLAKEGDTACAGIVLDVGRYIGIAVGNMINLFSPDEVVICGSIDTADALILEAVTRQIHETALPKMRDTVTVRLSKAKEKTPLMGAAVLIAHELFELPRIHPLLMPG